MIKFSEKFGNVAKALVSAAAEIKNVKKDTQGFGYKYATLDSILEMIRPVLAKNKLTIIQGEDIVDSMIVVQTILMHESGEYIETISKAPYIELKGMNSYQSLGAGITYLRRYAISSLLGIASEEDTDANVKAPQQTQYQKKSQPQAQPQKPNQTQQVQNQGQSKPDLKQLGIEIISQGNMLVAQENVQGAIFQNKEVLKQMGFKWNGQNKSWVKPA